LTILGAVFDTVWASVARNCGGHPGETEIVGIRLSAIVFEPARDGQLGPHQISHTASRLIREGHIESVQKERLAMPDNIQPIRRAFGPQALSVLQHCFADAWRELAGNFAAAEADAARSKPASVMLWMASNTQFCPTELIEACILVMEKKAAMNRIKNRLREADRRIRESTARIGAYH
jgi:hypothetical protein